MCRQSKIRHVEKKLKKIAFFHFCAFFKTHFYLFCLLTGTVLTSAAQPASRCATQPASLLIRLTAAPVGVAAMHHNWRLPGFHPARSRHFSARLLSRGSNIVARPLAAGAQVVHLVQHGVHDGVVAAVEWVDGVLTPERVSGCVSSGHTQTWVKDLEPQVVGKQEILEVSADLHQSLAEAGLEPVVESVRRVIVKVKNFLHSVLQVFKKS
jgi:hypothetical protein